MNRTEATLEYIGSIVGAIVLVITMAIIVLVVLEVGTLSTITQPWFVVIIAPLIIMSMIQVFGKDVYQVFKNNQ